jgi:ribosomal protein S18 acetylase RimI-like enzyme
VAIAIREAKPDDAALLFALARQTYADAFGHSMRAADLAAHLDNELSAAQISKMLREDTFLVACADTDAIGFVQFGKVDLDERLIAQPAKIEPSDGQVRRLYVQAAFQNRGVGTRLLEAALNHPRLRNSRSVYIDVWEENGGAQRLYGRYGFVKVGEKAFYVASGKKTGVDYILARSKA